MLDGCRTQKRRRILGSGAFCGGSERGQGSEEVPAAGLYLFAVPGRSGTECREGEEVQQVCGGSGDDTFGTASSASTVHERGKGTGADPVHGSGAAEEMFGGLGVRIRDHGRDATGNRESKEKKNDGALFYGRTEGGVRK